jgi:tetratricopeptide (TPR) repeat protein
LAASARIDELRKKLQAEPGSRLFAQLAEELRKGGDLPGAIAVAREGLEKHPGYWSARMTLGRALFDTGDLESAKSEFESVVKAAPDNILAGRYLAECLEGAGDLSGALTRLEQTARLAPSDSQLRERIEEVRARLASPARGPSGPAQTTDEELPPIPVSDYDGPYELEGPASFVLGGAQAEAPSGHVAEFEVIEAEPAEGLATIPFAGVEAKAAPLPAAKEPEPHDIGLESPTLAELYLSQGLTEKAREVYRRVVAAEPGHAQARARLAELDARAPRAESQEPTPRREPVARGTRRAEAIRAAIGRLERFGEAVRKG